MRPDPDQPRKFIDPEALADLTESIRLQGIIEPILFRVTPDSSSLIIVAGERRYRAAQDAGLFTLPGILVEGNIAEIALVENLQRQDLTCIEEAEALKKLMDDAQYTQEQLAGAIGKPRATVAEALSLTNLPIEIRDECRGNRAFGKKAKLNVHKKLVEIARKKQPRAMTTAFARYKEELRKKAEDAPRTRVKQLYSEIRPAKTVRRPPHAGKTDRGRRPVPLPRPDPGAGGKNRPRRPHRRRAPGRPRLLRKPSRGHRELPQSAGGRRPGIMP